MGNTFEEVKSFVGVKRAQVDPFQNLVGCDKISRMLTITGGNTGRKTVMLITFTNGERSR